MKPCLKLLDGFRTALNGDSNTTYEVQSTHVFG
jgi:hypothetical protein